MASNPSFLVSSLSKSTLALYTTMYKAIREGDKAEISRLMALRVSVNTKAHGTTALHEAARNGKIEILDYLVQCGADINIRDDEGHTVLHAAARCGQIETIDHLVSRYGLDVKAKTNDGKTALHYAVMIWDSSIPIKVIDCLMQHGADVHAKTNDGKTPLHCAVHSCKIESIKYLVSKYKVDIDAKTNDGQTVLYFAARFGTIEIIDYLVQHGADVKIKANNGATVLHYMFGGFGYGGLEIEFASHNINHLISRYGLDVEAKTDDGETVLHFAACSDDITTVDFWVSKYKLDINTKTNKGETALHLAARNSRIESIKYFVQHGADVKAKTNDGETALHLAVKGLGWEDDKIEAIIAFLVEHGADVNARTNNDQTALHLAAKCGRIKLIACLVQHRADVHAKDIKGKTALHMAALAVHGGAESLDYLVQHGADIRAKTNKGETICDIVAREDSHRRESDIGALYENPVTILYLKIKYGLSTTPKENVAKTVLPHKANTTIFASITASLSSLLNSSSGECEVKDEDPSYVEGALCCAAERGDNVEIGRLIEQEINFNTMEKDKAPRSGASQRTKKAEERALRIERQEAERRGKEAVQKAGEARKVREESFHNKKLDDMVKEGNRCYGRGEYARAIDYYSQAAKRNYPKAWSALARAYHEGKGVEKDRKETQRLFGLIETGAKQGNLIAQAQLGRMYFYGLGVLIDYKEACKNFRLAAERGNAEAQVFLGSICFERSGYSYDDKEAKEGVKWLTLAAKQGHAMGQLSLARMYIFGVGVSKDYNEALRLIHLAAQQSEELAWAYLGSMYLDGRGVSQDYKEALKWARLAAEQGEPEGQYLLGMIYANGYGVPRDYQEAEKWCRLAIEQKEGSVSSAAKHCLGKLYHHGVSGMGKYLSVFGEAEEALKWYRLAAEEREPEAQYCLGILYRDGIGVTRNYAEAAKWFYLAKTARLSEIYPYELQSVAGVAQKEFYAACNSGSHSTEYVKQIAEKERIKSLLKLAIKGNPNAQYKLAQSYFQLDRITRTFKGRLEAAKWYYLSAEQGHQEAERSLKNVLESVYPVRLISKEAVLEEVKKYKAHWMEMYLQGNEDAIYSQLVDSMLGQEQPIVQKSEEIEKKSQITPKKEGGSLLPESVISVSAELECQTKEAAEEMKAAKEMKQAAEKARLAEAARKAQEETEKREKLRCEEAERKEREVAQKAEEARKLREEKEKKQKAEIEQNVKEARERVEAFMRQEAEQKVKEAEERALRIERQEAERKAKEAERKEKEAQKKAEASRLEEAIRAEEEKAQVYIGRLKAFADEGNIEAQFSLGEMLLLGERDYGGRMAYEYIRAAALQGHGIARLYLGLFYEFGLHVEASLPAALFFYERADMRLGLRHLLLGVECLLENKFATVPYVSAGELFSLALCEESDAELMAEGDKKRLQEINTQLRAFFERIAFESNALSAHLLVAIIYMGGLLGAKKNPVQAEQFLQKIAESDHTRLQYNIGMMYEMGIWVEQDYKRAERWYEVAANKGLRCAQASLSNLYRLGHLGEVDLVKADKWAHLAESNAEKAVDKWSSMAESLPARKVRDVVSKGARRFLSLSEKLEYPRVTENVQTARVLYDFEPERDDKLPLKENEIVYVWDLRGDWWLCENKERREGRVPRNYVELLSLEEIPLAMRRLEDLPARAIKVKSHEIEIAQGQSELGRGGFGRVCEGRWLGVRVAVKQSHALYLDDNTKKEFEKEVEVMGTLRHPNIVQLLAYTEDTPTPWLVMEYMDRGTLYEYLGRRKEENKHIFLPFLVACDISRDIANGLMYLHGIGLVHRDIKSENILIRVKDGNHFFAQIADFGLSSFCRDENGNTMSLKTLRSDMFMGTIEYMAPELLGRAPYRYSEKTDMFSYGVIKWELITHEKPYRSGQFPARRSMRYNGAIRKYVSGGARLRIPEKAAPKGWWELTERCWSQKAEDRPKAREVLEELEEIRDAFLRSGNKSSAESSSSSASSSQAEIAAKASSLAFLPGMHPPIHSRNTSGRLAEFELENAEGRGDGFYAAVGLQLQKTNRAFLMGLTIAVGTSVEEVLEELIAGKTSVEEEDREEAIYGLAERSNSIVAIIDTRYPQLGFHCYFTGVNGERKKSYDVLEVPARRPIIRLAYTGEEFLSVNAHPDLRVGGLRAAFNGDVLGGYSLASSTTKLSNSRQAFTAQMSYSRRVSSNASGLVSRTLSSKEKEEGSRHSTGGQRIGFY